MKRLFIIFALLAVILCPVLSFGAGSVTQSVSDYTGGVVVVKLSCIGDALDGSIPNTAISADIMALLEGTHYLYTVSAYPTAGGTAPDPADVFILDANGEDLLGSVDGGTTAKAGLNLITAALKKTTFPYSTYLGQSYFPAVVNTLTLKVSGEATAGADYMIELVLTR